MKKILANHYPSTKKESVKGMKAKAMSKALKKKAQK